MRFVVCRMSVCLPPGRAAKCLIMGSAFGATHNADFAFPAFLPSFLLAFRHLFPTRRPETELLALSLIRFRVFRP